MVNFEKCPKCQKKGLKVFNESGTVHGAICVECRSTFDSNGTFIDYDKNQLLHLGLRRNPDHINRLNFVDIYEGLEASNELEKQGIPLHENKKYVLLITKISD